MAQNVTADKFRSLGVDWPGHYAIEEKCVIEDGKVNVARTIEILEDDRDFYKIRPDQAYASKMKYGVNYADFTDRHEHDSQMFYKLGQAISYLKEVEEAVEK